jgi:hypothetical protein
LEQAANHRANYRALFDSGDMQPIVDFLSQETVPTICLAELHQSTGIPLNTLKHWRRDLRSHPPRPPYSQPANISKRGLTQEQEEALVRRLRSEFIEEKKYCPPRLVQAMAVQIQRGASETISQALECGDKVFSASIRLTTSSTWTRGAGNC